MFEDSEIKRPSLGRLGFIGELYDIRNETFSSQSILKSSFPSNLIQCVDVNSFDFDYKFTENISDRFELFDVKGAIQMSILFGLIKLDGSGKFLTDDKKSEKTVSCSLKSQIQTVKEKFFGSFEEIIQYLDLSALENSNFTHMISEIHWGATCLLNLEYTCSSDSTKKEIQGRLAGEFSKLKVITVSGFAQMAKTNSNFLSEKGIEVKIRSDVAPKNNWPSTVEDFCRFVEEIPTLLKEQNNGKGKPQNYYMIPLSLIRGLAKLECSLEVIVKNIDDSFLVSTIYFFEELQLIKLKLKDLLSEMKENGKYVMEKEFKKVRDVISQLSSKESEMKYSISQDWVSVRSGQKDLRDLIRQMEKFKNHDLNLFAYETFIESYSPLREKLSTIKSFLSRGILYLGKDDKFKTVQCNSLSSEFIVLVISSEIEEADPELCTNTRHFFLTAVSEKKPNVVYVVVDLDYSEEKKFLNLKITKARCFHLKGITILSHDMYADFVAESSNNFTRLQKDFEINYYKVKPGNRTVLEIVCPLRCTPNPVVWNCSVCKQIIEYGFDDYYYCLCGSAPAMEAFQYRCSDLKHNDFVTPPDPEFVKACLLKLRPFKDLNILVIGQSGVGKSTWINSIVNYLTYESLEEAKENGVICTIPAAFTMYDFETLEKRVISVGKKDSNEVTEAGQSATQTPQTYSFSWNGFRVKLIDTPGLGDTRGIQQDKTNLANIIYHLGFFKEIHGLCILLKANDQRCNTLYVYCLKELLINLHRDVVKNIVFCFTNARSTLYSPGQAAVILTSIIEGLDVRNDFQLGHHTMYTLDNEAFMFLCSLQGSESELNQTIQASFAKSWEISLKETKRLFETIKSFEPHRLKDTISLVTARKRILSLTKPIAEISKTLQINLAAMEKKQKEIVESELTLEELLKKLIFTEIHLEPEPLNFPRTVCTNSSCVEYLTYKSVDVTEVEYKTHCHSRCYLKEVTPKTVNNHLLKNCKALRTGKCSVCGCNWENHMHLTYSQKRVERMAENKMVKKDLMEEKLRKQEVETFLEKLKTTIEQYKQEQEVILQVSVKFGLFLKKNSITPYNDAVADYIEYLIEEEEKKPDKTATEKNILKNLKETLEYYKAEVEVIRKVFEQSQGQDEELTAEAVIELEEKLYSLPFTGDNIRKSVKMNRIAEGKMNSYLEIPVNIEKKSRQFNSSIYFKTKEKTQKAISKIVDFIGLW